MTCISLLPLETSLNGCHWLQAHNLQTQVLQQFQQAARASAVQRQLHGAPTFVQQQAPAGSAR